MMGRPIPAPRGRRAERATTIEALEALANTTDHLTIISEGEMTGTMEDRVVVGEVAKMATPPEAAKMAGTAALAAGGAPTVTRGAPPAEGAAVTTATPVPAAHLAATTLNTGLAMVTATCPTTPAPATSKMTGTAAFPPKNGEGGINSLALKPKLTLQPGCGAKYQVLLTLPPPQGVIIIILSIPAKLEMFMTQLRLPPREILPTYPESPKSLPPPFQDLRGHNHRRCFRRPTTPPHPPLPTLPKIGCRRLRRN